MVVVSLGVHEAVGFEEPFGIIGDLLIHRLRAVDARWCKEYIDLSAQFKNEPF